MGCPHCRAPAHLRIDSTYELLGVAVPDGYCGRCGKQWMPPTRPVTPDPDPDPPGLEIEP